METVKILEWKVWNRNLNDEAFSLDYLEKIPTKHAFKKAGPLKIIPNSITYTTIKQNLASEAN